jgi:hypothetical protein
MRSNRPSLQVLAARIRAGDDAAAVQFLEEVQPRLIRIICRVIRTGETDSAIARRISDEVRSSAMTPLTSVSAPVINEISSRIGRATIEGIRSGQGVGHGILETVLGN